VFDASWAIPLEVLVGLQKRSLFRYSLANPQLGMVALLNGYLRIIDYISMKDLWASLRLDARRSTGPEGDIGILFRTLIQYLSRSLGQLARLPMGS
jgi:hypothetical protein